MIIFQSVFLKKAYFTNHINIRILVTMKSNGNHNGDVVHHHDHAIYPVSFNVMNIKNSIMHKKLAENFISI